jgi:hypothetical protein
MKIFEPNALGKMAEVEGPSWLSEQERRRSSPYGFYAQLDAWHAKLAYQRSHPDEEVGEVPLKDFAPGALDVIYGSGGYSRYAVTADGEIVLLGWSVETLPAKREKARAAGIVVA